MIWCNFFSKNRSTTQYLGSYLFSLQNILKTFLNFLSVSDWEGPETQIRIYSFERCHCTKKKTGIEVTNGTKMSFPQYSSDDQHTCFSQHRVNFQQIIKTVKLTGA